jgi:hypothetical protein
MAVGPKAAGTLGLELDRLGKNTRYRVSIRYRYLYRKVLYRNEKYQYSKKYGLIGTSAIRRAAPPTVTAGSLQRSKHSVQLNPNVIENTKLEKLKGEGNLDF